MLEEKRGGKESSPARGPVVPVGGLVLSRKGCGPSAGRESTAKAGRLSINSAYRWLSIKAFSCDFDIAPTLVASTAPFLKIISVGMPRTAYFDGVA